jgi:hypothetical protein
VAWLCLHFAAKAQQQMLHVNFLVIVLGRQRLRRLQRFARLHCPFVEI